jgi:cation:H+ antiporter
VLEQLGLLGNAVILIIALIALSKASSVTISNSIKTAETRNLTKTSVGFVLIAFSTSLPELFIAVFAVLEPEGVGVSIGNVLGSNIVNICLVLGICLIVVAALRQPKNAKTMAEMAEEEWGSLHFGLLVASMIPLALLYLGYASRLLGIVLLGVFFFYMYKLAKTGAKSEDAPNVEKKLVWKYTLFTILGALAVALSAFFIVDSASFLAASAGIPKVIVGATVVAFGTSIPELATSLDSVKRGHLDLALGNIVGSCFINVTAILGVTLVASPVNINTGAFFEIAIFSLIANLLLWYFLANKKIGHREGIVLLAVYVLFLVTSLSNVIG